MKKGIMIFCGLCVLVFAGWTIKCAVDFAENVEEKRKQQIEEVKKQMKELRELINAIHQEEPLDQDFGDWATGIKKIIQEIQRKYGGRIKLVAIRYGIDHKIIVAIIAVESSGNPRAVSCANARGLMQLMPLTAKIMGIKDVFHPYDNISGGARYLKYLEARFGDFDTALAAYNLGPTKVSELLKNNFNPSAYKYVRKIRTAMKEV